jgi:DNA-binding transcriptional MerR regulator
MSLPQDEVAADNARRRMEEAPKPPVGGVLENAVSLARPALAAASAVVAAGASAGTGLAVAGSVVAGLGTVDWFRKLGTAKVDENLESLGQATEDALNRVERVLLEHGTSIDEINRRLKSQEFKDGMASASLQALRTTQEDRLKRLALVLANGVKDDDLAPESTDDMMRAAVELKDADLRLLGEILEMQRPLFSEEWIGKQVNQRANFLQRIWQEYWNKDQSRYAGYEGVLIMASFARLQSLGMIGPGPDRSAATSPVFSCYWLLPEGKRFYERIQEIAA